MAGQTFTDEIDCGNCFDHIDDLIEFPPVTDTALNTVDFPNIWTNNSEELQVSDPIFSDSNCVSALSAELSVPYEDIVQLEWLSNFVEDSFSGGGLTMNKESIAVSVEKEPVVLTNYQFHMSSPISVLESSSSSSSSSSCSGGNGKMIPLSPTHRGPQRARSKRPRPLAFNPCAAIKLLSPVVEEKKRKKKPKKPTEESETLNNPEDKKENQGQGVRKCQHCEITKTPQWRAGPMGPKTLCNACGVRYKSGRLFPEYRPAASPTFVASLHSNSHKKVVEMRTKGVEVNNMKGQEITYKRNAKES